MLQLSLASPAPGRGEGGRGDGEKEEDALWAGVFDLAVVARKLEDAGAKVVLYVKQGDRPLVVSSHAGEQDLVDTLTGLIRRYMQQQQQG